MKLTYRPEIDGLRAIAVVAVILYHAEIIIMGQRPFKGGFIGVDIFFVISGYLITSIILKELVTTSSFSFTHFYERRIRRILPALLFVMLVSLPFAWVYLLPLEFEKFAKSILYSLGFGSNFYFHYSGSNYFELGTLKPFLHTWSLSVEEQYYILFPVILLITFKYFRKYLSTILVIGLISSLQIADWTSKQYSSYAFYMLITRMWELLAGSLLAYFEIIRGRRNTNKVLISVMPTIGIFLIFHSIIFFKNEMFHPSFYTLQPVFGVCLIIWYSNKGELVTNILSSKLFVGIGLISYSLYLWHYPIFIFNEILKTNIHWILLIILSIFLSLFSYFFIERPARNKKNKFKFILISIFSILIFLFYFNFNAIMKNGYEKRFYYSANYKISNIEHSNSISKFMENYNYDNYDDRKNVLIVGNCFGWDIFRILSNTNLSKQYYFSSALLKNKKSAFQVTHLYHLLSNNKKNIQFNEITEKQYEKAEYIILASEYTNADLEILDELLEILKFDNKKVLIFSQVAHQFTIRGLSLLDSFVYKNKDFPTNENLKKIDEELYDAYEKKNSFNLKIQNIINKRAVFFDRKRVFCDNNKSCPSITNKGYKIYWDVGHITEKASEFFAERIEKDRLFLEYLNSTPPALSN